MTLNIILLFTLLCNGNALRILGLFPHSTKSHHMAFQPLLTTLAERGHQITTVSFFPLKNPPANYTDVSLEGIVPIEIETFDINWAEQTQPIMKFLGIDGIMNEVIGFYSVADRALKVCKRLADLPSLKKVLVDDYDVILMENFSTHCTLGLMHLNGIRAPKIGMVSSPLMPWSYGHIGLNDNPAYVPTINMDYGDKMDFYGRLQNTFFSHFWKLWFRYTIQLEEQKFLENKFGVKLDLQALAMNMSVIFTNTFHEFNGVRPMLPGIVEVGGMHLTSKNVIPKYIEDFLEESDEGVILFSWGSLIKMSSIPAYKEDIIVKVLAKFPQRVIWKYEKAGPNGNLTGNILRVRWIPQYELLRHKKVVATIAHGGLLGMTETVAAGKPALVVPFFGDTRLNAAAAQRAGLGKVLKYTDITEETFEAALRQVLSPEMRLSAQQVSQRWKDRLNNPMDTAVYWVERIARYKHTSQLHSAARDMPFYQLSLLDVYGVAILMLVIILLILRYIVRLFLSLFMSTLLKEPKKKIN